MPVVPDFRLYHGNSLDVLASLLAAQLAGRAPGAPVLAPDTVLIPQPAMKRWLQKALAEQHGVAANLRFLTPGEFVRLALDANVPGDDGSDAAALRWRLWDVLADPAQTTAPAFAPLQPVLAGDDRALSAWSLAGELAAAFEKYQAWRRGWLLRWDGGADPHDWQAELWRRATMHRSHRARRLHAYLQRFDGDGRDVPQGLPPRLFAFACQNVSPDVLRVIASAARVGPLHFFFVSPVREWWGDLVDVRDRFRVDADGVFAADAEHPLLLADGRAGRDFVQLLFSGEAVHPSAEFTAYAAPATIADGAEPTLLHELQHDLLLRRPPPATPARAFAPQDRSLQVHACHTPLREVQVLHEQLRTLLEADPTLQPRDIAVLTPDVDAYAPLVHAVFGGATGVRAIPYAVADGSALAAQPLAGWWLQLLALPAARFTLPEGIALLSPAPVLQHLGLEPATLERLGDALAAAGARWGRDGAHREERGAGGAREYTWQWAIDRLLLGHAAGGREELAGVVPCDTLDGSELPAFDALLGGLRALERLAREFARPRPAEEWTKLLDAALKALLPERPALADDRRAVDDLRRRVGELAQEWKDAAPAGDLPVEVVRAWFQSRFAEPDLRQPFLAGGVTFGRMVPMRLIPFRVICLLGLDDGAYPRRDPGGTLNRLAAELKLSPRTPGDRSVREDDRFLFLQLFAAAGDVFYVSYLGADARSGEPRPPSVVVSELLDVAAKYRAAPAGPDAAPVRDRLVVRHPLHPFAPQAFGIGWPREAPEDAARRRPWQADWRAAAERADDVRRPPPPFVASPLPPRDEAPAMTRDELVRALRNPARHFLQRRLDVRLPQRDDPLPDSEPFALDDGLHRYALAERVFAALRAGDDDGEALARRLLAEGWLPPGPAGVEMLAVARGLAGGCARAARERAPDRPTPRAWRLDVDGVALSGRFDAVHSTGLLQFRPGQGHGGAQLAFGLDHLLWHAIGETRPVLRLLPGQAPCTLRVLTPAEARSRLQAVLDVARCAAREPLPFLPKAAYAWQQAVRSGQPEKAHAEAEKCWLGSDAGRYGEGGDPWVRLALRGHDPFADEDVDALRRFGELALTVFDALAPVEDAEAIDG
jgi:exodeoxyribonuclease V gamma subunit